VTAPIQRGIQKDEIDNPSKLKTESFVPPA